jgi:hypothetical protein
VLRAASMGPVRSRNQGQRPRQSENQGQEWNQDLRQLQMQWERQRQGENQDQGFRRSGTMGGYEGETGRDERSRDRLAELRRLERAGARSMTGYEGGRTRDRG